MFDGGRRDLCADGLETEELLTGMADVLVR